MPLLSITEIPTVVNAGRRRATIAAALVAAAVVVGNPDVPLSMSLVGGAVAGVVVGAGYYAAVALRNPTPYRFDDLQRQCKNLPDFLLNQRIIYRDGVMTNRYYNEVGGWYDFQEGDLAKAKAENVKVSDFFYDSIC